ncbi:MAG: hypothetical protein IKR04_02920 [Clostridia bacterium]|nr:hypothetical protein [Clostridia bacterium]
MDFNILLVSILSILFFFCLEAVIFILIFRKRNKLATKIVKRLMKTQMIPYRKTMAQIDEELTKMLDE